MCCEQYEKCFENLIGKVEALKIQYLNQSFSISLGCAVFYSPQKDFKVLYKRADECLYEAKKMGKGCFKMDIVPS